jgi:hypothetical protein
MIAAVIAIVTSSTDTRRIRGGPRGIGLWRKTRALPSHAPDANAKCKDAERERGDRRSRHHLGGGTGSRHYRAVPHE